MAFITIHSLSFRLISVAALWIIGTLLISGFTLSTLFREAAERAFDARLLVQLDALIAASGIDLDGNFVVRRSLNDPRFDRPYSGWYWQIVSNDRLLVRSRSLWDQNLAVETEPFSARYIRFGPNNQKLRLISRAIALPGYPGSLSFITTGDADEINIEIAAFNETLFSSLGVLGLGLIVAVFIQVQFGLLPLRKILRALSSVRTGEKQALEGRFPSEIQPLATEINGLITHNSEVLKRARTHVGNLAHALKTPLSILANEFNAKKDPVSKIVVKQTATMNRHINHYLTKARTAAASDILGARTNIGPVIEDLRRTLSRIHHHCDIRLEAGKDHPLTFQGERRDLEEILGNILDNAGKWAKKQIVITTSRDGARLRIDIDDDGPGLDPHTREDVFIRGKRLDEAKPGSGLGLAIVRDTAGLYNGDVKLADSPLGGLRVTLILPLAPTAKRG